MMFPGRSKSRLPGILPVAALVLLAGAATAQGLLGSRYPISGMDVVKELGVVGIDVEASQVRIPAGMTTASISPKLEIVMAEPMENNQLRVELRCSVVAECLPFFATLNVKEANLVSTEMRLRRGGATAASRQAALHVGATPTSQPQIKVGSHATLIIQDGHLDIRLQVLAIDTGALGQQVRVCTLDRKKIFHATVTGEGTVVGVIE